MTRVNTPQHYSELAHHHILKITDFPLKVNFNDEDNITNNIYVYFFAL